MVSTTIEREMEAGERAARRPNRGRVGCHVSLPRSDEPELDPAPSKEGSSCSYACLSSSLTLLLLLLLTATTFDVEQHLCRQAHHMIVAGSSTSSL